MYVLGAGLLRGCCISFQGHKNVYCFLYSFQAMTSPEKMFSLPNLEGGEGRRQSERGEEGGRVGIILCDGNYGLGAYVMEWVHNREHERNRVTS